MSSYKFPGRQKFYKTLPFLLFVALFITGATTVIAEEIEFEDTGVILGGGFVVHTFADKDDFRTASVTSNDNTEIPFAVGIQAYFEYYFTSIFSVGLKVQT